MSGNAAKPSKFSLIEIVQKTWLPLIGFFGGVVSIYEFVDYWRSDRLTINWIIISVGLLLWFVGLAYVGFSLEKEQKGSILVNERSEKSIERFVKQFPHWFRLARVLLALSFVVLVLSAFAYRYHVDEIRRIRQEKIVVLIASFDGPENTYGVQNKLIEKLRSETSGFEEVSIVPIKEVITTIDGSEYARKLGKENDADLVLWGWYRPTENTSFTVHVEMLAPNEYSEYALNDSETFEPLVLLNSMNSFSWQQELGTDMSALVVFLSGLLYQRDGVYSESAVRFTKALELSSKSDAIVNDSDVLLYRGGAYSMSGKNQDAISDFDLIIANDPQYELLYLVYNERGATYADRGEYDRAIQDYNQAIQIDPNKAIVYINRGTSYLGIGEPELALQDFDKGIELGLETDKDAFQWMGATAYNNRGYAYSLLGDLDSAISNYTEALNYNPNHFTSLLNRGIVYDDLGKYDLAIADYNRAIEIRPNDVSPYIDRGVAYVNKNEFEKAIQDYSRGIEIDPECALCYKNRAIAYNLLGDKENFLSDANKYCDLVNNNSSLCE